jgi:hypothetical protein
MSALSKRENVTIAALAECILPDGGPNQCSFKNIDYLPFIKETMTSVPTQVRWLIHFNLWFIEYFGCFFIKRLALFSKLGPPQRTSILLCLQNNKRYFLRGIYILTSSIFLIPMYKDESVMNAIGYFGYKSGVNKIP